MRRVLRIALMWLLALAVPVQGVAATTMLSCGPNHASAAATAAPHDEAPHHAQVGQSPHHEQQHQQQHGQGHENGHDTAGNDDTGGDDDTGAVKVATQKCSACASCCTAAMLPATASASLAPVVPDFVAPGLPADVADFLTDGPERPPRLLLD